MNGASAVHMSIFGMQPIVRVRIRSASAAIFAARGQWRFACRLWRDRTRCGKRDDAISTFASRVDGGYRVRGRKVWTSKALESERVLLLVRTTPREACKRRTDGLTLLFAELQRPEVVISPIPKAGRNAVASCEVVYDDLFVAGEDRIGEEGKGFCLSSGWPQRRTYSRCGRSLGHWPGGDQPRNGLCPGTRRFRPSHRSKPRRGFFHLRKPRSGSTPPKLMIRQACAMFDAGQNCGSQANMAKFLAADAGYQAADIAMQTHGGFGYAREYHVERYWRKRGSCVLLPSRKR